MLRTYSGLAIEPLLELFEHFCSPLMLWNAADRLILRKAIVLRALPVLRRATQTHLASQNAVLGRVSGLWTGRIRSPGQSTPAFAPSVLGRVQHQRSVCWLGSRSERSRDDRKGPPRATRQRVLTPPLGRAPTSRVPRPRRGTFRQRHCGTACRVQGKMRVLWARRLSVLAQNGTLTTSFAMSDCAISATVAPRRLDLPRAIRK